MLKQAFKINITNYTNKPKNGGFQNLFVKCRINKNNYLAIHPIPATATIESHSHIANNKINGDSEGRCRCIYMEFLAHVDPFMS